MAKGSERSHSGWPWWAWTAAVVVGLVLLVGLVLAVWKVPELLYNDPALAPKGRADVESSTRTGIIAGLAGLAALGSLVVTSRTYRITEQGHITDRYTKAIQQVGDEKLAVRLGGIYALERLAVDSDRDHPTVVEVLSAVVRETSRPQENKKAPPEAGPPADVRAALAVLGRLPVRKGVGRGGDLSRANMVGVDLIGANLTGVYLAEAALTGADLSEARLDGADLSRADLIGARLSGADLTGARLTHVDLTGASLAGAVLVGANLVGAELASSDLVGADLSGAWLEGATLAEANVEGADMKGTYGLTISQVRSARGDALRLPKA